MCRAGSGRHATCARRFSTRVSVQLQPEILYMLWNSCPIHVSMNFMRGLDTHDIYAHSAVYHWNSLSNFSQHLQRCRRCSTSRRDALQGKPCPCARSPGSQLHPERCEPLRVHGPRLSMPDRPCPVPNAAHAHHGSDIRSVDGLSTDAQVTKFCEGKGLPSDAPGCYLLSKSLVKGANCHPIFGLGKPPSVRSVEL